MPAATKRAAAKAEAATDAVTEAADAVMEKTTAVIERTQQALDDVADTVAPKIGGERSKLPPVLQFPLAVTLSFAMASLGYSLLGEVTKGELAAVSKSQDTWGEVGVLAAWRLTELAIGWFGKLDSLDVATMDLLSHGPTLYLLTSFYSLRPLTALSALIVDILSVAVPFYLLRPLSPNHTVQSFSRASLLDPAIILYTTALSTAIYAVTLVLSLTKLLPSVLVVHFNGIPSLTPAYDASYATVIPVTLLFGFASAIFIFAPFAEAGPAPEDSNLGEFDPSKASLGETVYFNFWGYTAKTKVIIRRTAVATIVTAINTYLACTMTIWGIKPAGAAAYASVWAFAAVCTGLGLGLVGGD